MKLKKGKGDDERGEEQTDTANDGVLQVTLEHFHNRIPIYESEALYTVQITRYELKNT